MGFIFSEHHLPCPFYAPLLVLPSGAITSQVRPRPVPCLLPSREQKEPCREPALRRWRARRGDFSDSRKTAGWKRQGESRSVNRWGRELGRCQRWAYQVGRNRTHYRVRHSVLTHSASTGGTKGTAPFHLITRSHIRCFEILPCPSML